MEKKTKVALYIRKKVEYVREFSITWKQIHTNKRVDQLGQHYSILTKVHDSRFENAAALNT